MPNTSTILTNFRFDAPTRSKLKRIVKQKRAAEPDKKKKSEIHMTSVVKGFIHDFPVDWKA